MNFIKLIIIGLCFMILKAHINRLDPKRVAIAINCGSDLAYKSLDGFEYQADNYYSEDTKTSDWTSDPVASKNTIKYTDDNSLFMTERWANADFTYELPVDNLIEGEIVVISQHSENAFEYKNQRVMNILIGDCLVKENLDIPKLYGRFVANNIHIPLKYSSNKIYHKSKECQNAIINGSIIIKYQKTNYDNPQVQGLILYNGGLNDTDYYKFKSIKKEFDIIYEKENLKKKLEDNYRKMYSTRKLKKKIRNNYEEFHEEFDEFITEAEEASLDNENKYFVLSVFSVVSIILIILLKNIKFK